MEGLEVSEVLLSHIDLGDRFDAEFFAKSDLEIEIKLIKKKSVELRTLGEFVASAFYPSATHLYEIGNTPFIRCVDCVNFPVITQYQNDLFEKLPMSFITEEKGINLLNKNDIVITKVGTPSYASIIYEHEQVALSRTVLGMRNIEKVDPLYLLIFLRSKYGFSQLQRHRELTIQYQLTLERTKRVLVYLASKNIQQEIANLAKRSIEYLTKARLATLEAENLLLNCLHLSDFTPPRQTVNIKLFSESFRSSGRLDAEFYQPKYDYLIQQLAKSENAMLKMLVKIKKSIEPGSAAYDKNGLPFIRVSDYDKFQITTPAKYLSDNYYAKNKMLLENLMPKRDTILFSKDGTIGIAYLLTEDLKGVTSGAILHLNIKDKRVLPEYLTLVLNSPVVQIQAERDVGGSIIPHWRKEEIENVIIPIISMETQIKIATLIKQSNRLRAKSKILLKQAKKIVELAVEQDENTALKFIWEMHQSASYKKDKL
ncbi:restriction endonuclease subunit S [Bartonella sp. B30(2025)]